MYNLTWIVFLYLVKRSCLTYNGWLTDEFSNCIKQISDMISKWRNYISLTLTMFIFSIFPICCHSFPNWFSSFYPWRVFLIYFCPAASAFAILVKMLSFQPPSSFSFGNSQKWNKDRYFRRVAAAFVCPLQCGVASSWRKKFLLGLILWMRCLSSHTCWNLP